MSSNKTQTIVNYSTTSLFAVCYILSQTSFYLRRCFSCLIRRAFLRTLSVNRCLHLISSSASSFPVIRPSSFDLASSFTRCQTSSFFIMLPDTRSFVKCKRWLVCSSVNSLQYLDESVVKAGALAGPDSSLWHVAKERNLSTFSLLVSCSTGGKTFLLYSLLIRRSFRMIDLSECVFRKCCVETFALTSLSLITPVSISSLKTSFNLATSSSVH